MEVARVCAVTAREVSNVSNLSPKACWFSTGG
jgi:hypothetical protein